MIKWTVKDVIEAVEKAMKPNADGSNQLLQQLKAKQQQTGVKSASSNRQTTV